MVVIDLFIWSYYNIVVSLLYQFNTNYLRNISDWSLYLSPAKSYLDRSTCGPPIQYSQSQRSLMAPFPHPLHTTRSPSPLHHSTQLQLTSHPSWHHSSLSLLTVPLTPPQTTPTYHSSDHSPSPLPHTTHNSSLLPHTAPLSVVGTRNNVAVMIDHAFLICAVSLPVHKTVLQLDR